MLLEAIGRGKTDYLAAKKFSESSVHLFGQKLFYTAPYEKVAKKAWGILPYAQKRAKGVDTLRTAFIPFHKATQEAGEAVKAPFLKFYRQTAYQTSRARAEIKKVSKQTPKEFSEDVVTQLEIKHIFRNTQEELAAREAAKAGGEPISAGMEAAGRKSDAILQAAEDTIARRKLATEAFNQHEAKLLEAATAEEYATAASEVARKAQDRANILRNKADEAAAPGTLETPREYIGTLSNEEISTGILTRADAKVADAQRQAEGLQKLVDAHTTQIDTAEETIAGKMATDRDALLLRASTAEHYAGSMRLEADYAEDAATQLEKTAQIEAVANRVVADPAAKKAIAAREDARIRQDRLDYLLKEDRAAKARQAARSPEDKAAIAKEKRAYEAELKQAEDAAREAEDKSTAAFAISREAKASETAAEKNLDAVVGRRGTEDEIAKGTAEWQEAVKAQNVARKASSKAKTDSAVTGAIPYEITRDYTRGLLKWGRAEPTAAEIKEAKKNADEAITRAQQLRTAAPKQKTTPTIITKAQQEAKDARTKATAARKKADTLTDKAAKIRGRAGPSKTTKELRAEQYEAAEKLRRNADTQRTIDATQALADRAIADRAIAQREAATAHADAGAILTLYREAGVGGITAAIAKARREADQLSGKVAADTQQKASDAAHTLAATSQKDADKALAHAADLTIEAIALRRAVGPAPPPKTKAQILADAEALVEESVTIDRIREKAQLEAGTVLANARNIESGAATATKDTVATRTDDPFDTQSIGESAASRAIAALDPEATPPPAAAVTAADELRAIYDAAFKEKLDLGIAQEGSYRQSYMHHALTKEGQKWVKETHGGTVVPGKHGPLRQRKLEGSVFEVNERMREDFGIKQFFVEDPYIATQMYMAKHARQVQSHLLHKKILKDYGRDTDAAIGLAPEIARIEGKEYTLYKRSGKETYLPTAVHKELTRTQPHHSWWTDTYDPTLGALKKSWLSMWPGYYARNLYGGVGWQNLLAGTEPKDYARNIDVLYGDPNKIYDIPLYGKKTGKELKELMESHNVLGQTGYVGEPSAIGPLSPLGQIYQKYPETAMKLSENQLRGPVFMHYLYKTGDPEYAAEMVYKYHFEYLRGTYTAFEEDALFRAVPFGKWQRGNIPLQMEMMFRKPGIFAAQAKLYDMGSTPEEFNEMPEWQQEKLTYTHKGNVYTYDMPIMDVRSMLDPAAMYATTTPFLQYGVSEIRGKTRYGKDMDPWGTWEGAQQHGELAATIFQGRLFYAGREAVKTAKGDRPVSATAIHQLGGVGVYEAPPPPKPVSTQAFKAERWRESGAYAAWLAAGGTEEAPEDTGEPIKITSGRRRDEARVIRVIDADTIEVELHGRIQTVRYLGIDAPETKHPHKPIGLGGFEATAANKRLVKGQTVYLEKDQTYEDKYGRLLRNVFLEDDTFVNAELVRLGYAKEKYYRPDKRYKELLEELEAEAPEIKAVHPWGGYASLEEQEHAVWVAAGSPEDFHIKTLSDGSKLALTHEAYEAAKGFKTTEEDLQYINSQFPELSALESPMQTALEHTLRNPPGSREARYNQLVAEREAYKSGEMRLEQPTPEQEQESWERAGLAIGEPYKHKIYRDDLGKLLGIATYTPEELEEMGGWTPSETEAEWAFRETRKITPKEQLKIWAQEHEDELLQEEALEEAMREELHDIRANYAVKGEIPLHQRAGGGDTRRRRRQELEEMLGIGVDR